MFTKKTIEPKLEREINRALEELAGLEPSDDKYPKILGHIETLHKLRSTEKPSRVSADTVASISANLAGILLIIHHERVNVIASKALGFVGRTK